MENEPVKITNPSSQYWKYRWTIKHFSCLKTNIWHRSDAFLIGSYTCRLVIQPKTRDNHLSIYFEIDPVNQPFAKVKLFVIDQMDSTKRRGKFGSDLELTIDTYRRGHSKFLSRNELEDPSGGFIVNDTIVIEAYIYIRGVTEGSTKDSIEVNRDSMVKSETIGLDGNEDFVFKEGAHCQIFEDGKFVDIRGFNVLKSQASLYQQIWLKYGHIATSNVLTASPNGQVSVVCDILVCITEMNQCHPAELSSEKINSWEKKIKMAEKLEFNIMWLREHFDKIKNDFFVEEKLKAALVEQDEAKKKLMLANEEVMKLQEKLSAIESKISLLQKEILLGKGKKSLFDQLF